MAKKLEKFFNFLTRLSLRKEINNLKNYTGDVFFEYAGSTSKGLTNMIFAFTKEALYISTQKEVEHIPLENIKSVEIKKKLLSTKLHLFTQNQEEPIAIEVINEEDIFLVQKLIEEAKKSYENTQINSSQLEIETRKQESIPREINTSFKEIEQNKKTKFEFPETSVCPYCHSKIKTPKRKKKCPKCGQYIYVRTKHNLPIDRFLFKEEELPFLRLGDFFEGTDLEHMFKENYDKNKTIKDNIKEFIENLNEYNLKGIKVSYYAGDDSQKIQMPLEYLYDMKSVLYESLYEVEKKPKYKNLSFEYRRKSIIEEVKNMKKAGIKNVCIDVVGDRLTCKNCSKLDNKIFSIDEFLKNPPIPHKNCSSKSGCRCSVSAHFDF